MLLIYSFISYCFLTFGSDSVSLNDFSSHLL
nr:MAG TPA: hypothetical protein [Caudoviricetes sp.]